MSADKVMATMEKVARVHEDLDELREVMSARGELDEDTQRALSASRMAVDNVWLQSVIADSISEALS